MTFVVRLSDNAMSDMADLSDAIAYTFASPLTEIKYMRELKAVIQSLATNPERYPIRHNYFMQQYGANARRVNYKKMAIIYTIHENTVRIHRVIASSLILE